MIIPEPLLSCFGGIRESGVMRYKHWCYVSSENCSFFLLKILDNSISEDPSGTLHGSLKFSVQLSSLQNSILWLWNASGSLNSKCSQHREILISAHIPTPHPHPPNPRYCLESFSRSNPGLSYNSPYSFPLCQLSLSFVAWKAMFYISCPIF